MVYKIFFTLNKFYFYKNHKKKYYYDIKKRLKVRLQSHEKGHKSLI